MAVAEPGTHLAMTDEQRRSFDEQGFIVIEDFFSDSEFNRLLNAMDEVAARIRAEKGVSESDPFALRNALTHHAAFLDLIDNPRILPLVVDAIGWNIQIRTTHLDYRPPYPEGMVPGELGTGEGADHAAGYKNLVWHPDLAGPYLFEAPSNDGRLPFMEIKVGYYLSDLTAKNSGAICLVPGSHRRSPQELRDMQYRVPDEQYIELNVRPNTALLWRTQVWHCVTPNLSNLVRKVFYVGYHYRWLRPTDYIQQDPDLIERSSPIRRQLLGALDPSGGDPLGSDPFWEPSSRYWLIKNWDDVPLKKWAEDRAGQQQTIEKVHI
ncbi:MAG: phytanoyl-CoA dioxygenase family protein [Chloroflexi bacterium]|nr:phytanoyl-CoA dioxygenase family protein [Chloroflexota bacterium]